MSLVSLLGLKPKTPRVKTLGVLLFGIQVWSVASLAAGDCMPAGSGELAQVERVYDGDTLKLQDGRHVRILGLNTPEIDHGKARPGQPLGEDARRAAEAFVRADKTIRLFYDTQRVDRYGRTLAHVYDAKGNSLAAHLLRKGLGFHVAIPPNLSLHECLAGQESSARKKALGVWRHPEWQPKLASALSLQDTGFQRISGRVVSVRKAQSIWLELDGPVAIKITPSDIKNFPVRDWQSWEGRRVEVRGWVTERSSAESTQKKTKATQKKTKNSAKKAKASGNISYQPLIVQPRIASSLELLD